MGPPGPVDNSDLIQEVQTVGGTPQLQLVHDARGTVYSTLPLTRTASVTGHICEVPLLMGKGVPLEINHWFPTLGIRSPITFCWPQTLLFAQPCREGGGTQVSLLLVHLPLQEQLLTTSSLGPLGAT